MFLVTDWLSMDLYDFMNFNYNQFTEQMIRVLFKMSVEGVQYLHEQNHMHRDIKPENILVDVDWKNAVKGLQIADFGFVCEIGKQDESKEIGTYGYQAPEVLEGKEYNELIDNWSLGVLLFNLVTG